MCDRIWNEREKNLDLVMRNTSQMFGSIWGIDSNEIGPVRSFELLECVVEPLRPTPVQYA